jgi:transposase
VSRLAQQHGINVNMLFKWRRHWVAGLFDAAQSPQAMLPVAIVEAPASMASVVATKRQAIAVTTSATEASAVRQGIIEMQIADATVRFDGQADLAALRAVIRMLRT